MFDAIISVLKESHGMALTRRNDNGFEVRGRRAPNLRSAQRRALVAAHTAELAVFDNDISAEVVPTTYYLGSGAYAPVVTVAIVD